MGKQVATRRETPGGLGAATEVVMDNERWRRVTLLVSLAGLVAWTVSCSQPEPIAAEASVAGEAVASGVGEGGGGAAEGAATRAMETVMAEEAVAAAAIPERVGYVIPREPDGEWNIDGRLHTDVQPWMMHGVEIDNRRIHPPQQSAALSDEAQAKVAALLAAMQRMPRCEPLALLDGERGFRIKIDDIVYSGPAMWWREGGIPDPDDLCLVPVRIAAELYAAWQARERRR